MYAYGYRYNSGLVLGAGGGAPFANAYSLDFDGVDDYVNLGRITAMEGATNFSFSMWVNPTSYTGLRLLFGKFASATNFFYAYTSNSFGYIFWHIADGQTNYPRVSTTSRIDLNTWGLLTFVYDGSLVGNLNKAKIYMNGTLALTTTTAFQIPSSISLDTTDFYLAQRNGALDTPTSGKIDEVSAYDYSLSASEVMDIYNLGTPTDLSLLATPPIHWYRMGDNGSYKSPQWLIPNNENFAANKVSNYSFELDGIDDYVNIPNNTDLNFSSAYSVSFWIKTTSSALLSPISNQSKFLIRLYAPVNQIRLQLYDGSNGFLNLDNTQVFNDGNWHHIAFTTEATTTADKVIVYFDGVALTNKGTQTNIGSHLSAFPYEIGRNSGTWNFNGGIDEVSLYDSELSASQISDIYNGGTPSTISGAIAHYKMGEEATFSGGVWTVPDSAGSNNGTSNAMTIDDRVGEAPNSTSNALSYNMDLVDRVEDTP